MDINFNGYGENIATFLADSSITKAGTPVKMKSPFEVTACASGDNMIGVAVNIRDGYAAVQLSGYVELDTSDSAITVGYNKLAVSTNNTVESSETGREYLVVNVGDECAGFIL